MYAILLANGALAGIVILVTHYSGDILNELMAADGGVKALTPEFWQKLVTVYILSVVTGVASGATV